MESAKRNPQIFPLGRSAPVASEPIVPLEPEIVDDNPEGSDVTETKKCGQFFPVEEADNVHEMYEYYESLGKRRTLSKVAVQFQKSHSTLAVLSGKYGWVDRAKAFDRAQDPVQDEVRGPIDKSRKKLADVVSEITDTLHEIMFIARACKHGRMTPEQESKLVNLQKSLRLWGFEWKNPSSFKSLVETLKQITDFYKETVSKVPAKATQTNIEKFELHIRD